MLKLFLTVIGVTSIFVSVSAYSDHGKPPIKGIVNNFIELRRPAPAPITPLLSRDQGQINLESFHGKFVLLNFWATWCVPCVRELPSLSRLNAQLSDKNFQVVLVSQDRAGFKQTDKFIEKHKIDIPQAFIDNKLKYSRAMDINSIPTTILIGTDGVEIGRLVGSIEWDHKEAIALINYYLGHKIKEKNNISLLKKIRKYFSKNY
jgi:thiol-disulfide isomerase/thioredoxin